MEDVGDGNGVLIRLRASAWDGSPDPSAAVLDGISARTIARRFKALAAAARRPPPRNWPAAGKPPAWWPTTPPASPPRMARSCGICRSSAARSGAS